MGLLKRANGGVLFLDEIGELGLEEQAMLLRSIETGRYYPVGSDREEESRFQLIAGTNKDLKAECSKGKFREDLLARINLWTYHMPGLSARRDDIEPNIEFELDKFARQNGRKVSFNREALQTYLAFANSQEATWPGNFRDLAASVTRMGTLAPGGRISDVVVDREIQRLQSNWSLSGDECNDPLLDVLAHDAIEQIDQFDKIQLREVVKVCRSSRSLAEAGRQLFQVSRAKRSSNNDSDRLRKYLAKFGLDWASISEYLQECH